MRSHSVRLCTLTVESTRPAEGRRLEPFESCGSRGTVLSITGPQGNARQASDHLTAVRMATARKASKTGSERWWGAGEAAEAEKRATAGGNVVGCRCGERPAAPPKNE